MMLTGFIGLVWAVIVIFVAISLSALPVHIRLALMAAAIFFGVFSVIAILKAAEI